MCPYCGHNLCNNETLTGVELEYVVKQKFGNEWIDTTSLRVIKQPIEESTTPAVTWNYKYQKVIGK